MDAQKHATTSFEQYFQLDTCLRHVNSRTPSPAEVNSHDAAQSRPRIGHEGQYGVQRLLLSNLWTVGKCSDVTESRRLPCKRSFRCLRVTATVGSQVATLASRELWSVLVRRRDGKEAARRRGIGKAAMLLLRQFRPVIWRSGWASQICECDCDCDSKPES